MEPMIQLRDVIDSDLPVFFEHQSNPEATEMASFPARDRETFMTHWARILKNDSNVHKTILYNGQVAGNIVSFMMEGKREVGYWIGQEFWGKGIATRALKEFLAHVKTRPLHGVVAKHNHGSRRVLEKCGFVLLREEGNEIVLILN